MPFTKAVSTKERILISGMSNTGKTTSLSSFIYGPNNYYDEDQHEDALEYAGSRRMVILTCPGEKGHKSLPNTEHITSYYYETEDVDINSAKWSEEALTEFNAISKEIIDTKPDILAVDGFHALWDHIMNRTTKGDYLAGNRIGSPTNPYESARLYSQAHNAFGQYITGLYYCQVPIVIATTWEDWQSGTAEQEAGKAQPIQATRYLWPSIPGKMAMAIVGQFDMRLSARIERRCIHKNCTFTKANEEHHVWQFMNKGDVRGVGIKGLRRIPKEATNKPFIHQDYHALKQLVEAYS